jgi:LacI family transcriptional regulator
MAELGFVPSRAAGQLRSRRSELVGVVVPDVGNPYWASVLRGIESVIEQHGLALVVGSTHQETTRQRRLLKGLESQGVDGLILAPITADSADWEPFVSRRFGVVALERSGAGPSVPSVGLDNVEGGRLAVTHLWSRAIAASRSSTDRARFPGAPSDAKVSSPGFASTASRSATRSSR